LYANINEIEAQEKCASILILPADKRRERIVFILGCFSQQNLMICVRGVRHIIRIAADRRRRISNLIRHHRRRLSYSRRIGLGLVSGRRTGTSHYENQGKRKNR
jgi:hypothetical protein